MAWRLRERLEATPARLRVANEIPSKGGSRIRLPIERKKSRALRRRSIAISGCRSPTCGLRSESGNRSGGVVVSASRTRQRELAAIEQSKLLPGFPEVAELTAMDSREAILAHLQKVLPGAGTNTLRNFAAQLNQFVNRIEIGDYVVMPRKLTNGVAIGVVKGNYQFDAENDYKHSRSVEWEEESLPRDTFKQDLRHSFGAFMTICQIKRNSAFERVKAVLETGTDPGSLLGKQGQVPKSPVSKGSEDDDTDAEDYQPDIEDIANQQIISLMKSEFAGHALADLVAEIMRVEGYTTKVWPPWP